MTQVLQHAIYPAVLKTEAMATFMFLPASGKLMTTNPSLRPLSAYPHLCCKLGTFLKIELAYDNPQSWPSQDVALAQHTWDIQIIAPGIARYIPEAKWFVKNVRNDLIRSARHAVMPGIEKCKMLFLDKKQTAKVPHKPAAEVTAPVPCQSKQISSSKLHIGCHGPTQTAAARFRTAQQL
eukprot:317147-Pelagomonas_calceolata.AAC.3